MSENLNMREVPRMTPLTMMEAIREEVKPSALDRVVSFFSPESGARRLKARAMLAMGGWSMGGGFLGGGQMFRGGFNNYPGGYKGARLNRRELQNWYLRNNSANADTIFDLPTLRERSRDLCRNAPLAAGAIGTVCMNVVGPGLQLQSMIEPDTLNMDEDAATEWQTTVEREFRLWCESPECDITRTQNFYGLQNLVFRAALESGDVIALLPMASKSTRIPYTLRVQVVEGDRLANPFFRMNTETFCGGVEMDEQGAPINYHILRKHPGAVDRIGMLVWDKYPAFGTKTKRRNVLHLFDKTRPGQTRGVPYLAPVIETIKQLDRYAEAEVMAAVVAAMFTVFVQTERSEGFQPATSFGGGGSAGASPGSGEETRLASGAVVELNPGEDIKIANPGRPNQQFDGFVTAMARQIGTALGLPFEVLMKHFTASYSASRAALLDAWRFFRVRREWLGQQFCQPIYEAFMDEAVSNGRISAPGYFDDPALRQAYLASNWLGDAPMQIDPMKEVAAAEKRLGLNITTLAKETAELNGGVWTDNIRQAAKERKMMLDAGLINTTTSTGPPMQRETLNITEGSIPESAGSPDPGAPGTPPGAPGQPPPKSPAPGKKPPAPGAPPTKQAPAKTAVTAKNYVNRLQIATLQIEVGQTDEAKETLRVLADELRADGTLDDLQSPQVAPKKRGKKKSADGTPKPGEDEDDDTETGDEEDEEDEPEPQK
jgi:lambda family phage portal protein